MISGTFFAVAETAKKREMFCFPGVLIVLLHDLFFVSTIIVLNGSVQKLVLSVKANVHKLGSLIVDVSAVKYFQIVFGLKPHLRAILTPRVLKEKFFLFIS